MKKIILLKSLLFLGLLFSLVSCVDPYKLQTTNYEEVIVIEATITNELKRQEIKISKTYTFENDGPVLVENATVFITDDSGTQYDFTEESGRYLSNNEFQAITGKNYTLNVATDNGRMYKSTPQTLTTINQIESLVPTVVTNNEGERGVQIAVNNFDATNTSKYYRYEYEETAKVTAPLWRDLKAILLPPTAEINHFYISLIPRDTEARTCYTPTKSNSIILTTTNQLSEDRVVNFPVRFLSQNDYTIAERYSILVKQYLESLESYTFYRTLKEISASGDVLSPSQPGFFSGNLTSVSDSEEKVIGFFNVSSVSEKRLFFNYTDLFPGEQFPPYFDDCELSDFNYCFQAAPADCDGTRLNNLVQSNSLLYYSISGEIYTFIKPICGDCTSFSSNIRPTFWID
ncbi:DUF4249 domain-containing protein [Flavobacterium sp.]|uniref:DUF4249 domain-containing protein n=1 Tax=Flavobacterium sp. TaxID=239 RepID=UPI00375187DA